MVYNIILLAGLILFGISLYFLKKSLDFLKSGTRTTAVVVQLHEKSDSDGRTWAPVFEYKTHQNQKIRYNYPISSSPAAWTVGEEAAVVYDPNNPENAKVLTYFGTFGRAVIFMAIALPMLLIGGGYYLSLSYLK